MSTERVSSTFTRSRDGKELKMRIETLPDDMYEEVLIFWLKYFIPDEPIHKALKISETPEVLDEYLVILRLLAMNIVYQVDACHLDEHGREKIVGVSVMVLERKDKFFEDFKMVKPRVKSKPLKKIFSLLKFAEKKGDVYKRLNVEACYKGRGLAVHTEYRGLGIAVELLKTRATICKEQSIPVTCAWMTSLGIQKAGEKLSWDTVKEIPYKRLKRQSGIKFEKEPSLIKLMVARV